MKRGARSADREGIDSDDCIRCNDGPRVDANGYCGHCHWIVRAEIESGYADLREYLRRWARFLDWCVRHGRL